MKITILTPALVAVLGLALASAPVTAQAQTTNSTTAPAAPAAKAHKTNLPISTITAIDTTGNTVTVLSHSKANGDKTLTIAVDATTQVTRDKKTATLADFKVGEKVTGSYTDNSGTLTAAKLTYTTAKAKAPKKAAGTAATPASTPSTNAPAATQ